MLTAIFQDLNMHGKGESLQRRRLDTAPGRGDRGSREYRKESIQKTIMAMTLGKDVSALFPDVLKNIATGDLDQKKLVYLYLMFVAPKTFVGIISILISILGTTPNHIRTSAFSPSTPSSKMPKTLTR
jgi:Adaptin N terminal region